MSDVTDERVLQALGRSFRDPCGPDGICINLGEERLKEMERLKPLSADSIAARANRELGEIFVSPRPTLRLRHKS